MYGKIVICTSFYLEAISNSHVYKKWKSKLFQLGCIDNNNADNMYKTLCPRV